MGNLLRLLRSEEGDEKIDFFVDFENAQPTPQEGDTHGDVSVVLNCSKEVLSKIESYEGATESIRDAISNPRDTAMQDKAWDEVVQRVHLLRQFFEFSVHLTQVVPRLLRLLCAGPSHVVDNLEHYQSTVKQFAEILDFTLRFDDIKMSKPAIQNDFSYYRRTLSRLAFSSEEESRLIVDNEMANRMSLFYAQATPMMKVLSDATTKFVTEHKQIPIENTSECLSTMANICRAMVSNPAFSSRFSNEATVFFILRVMVGVIILYDHVYPVGAFAKSSNIEVKSCIKLLKEYDGRGGRVEGLLNALRYTTKHLNDESTPKSIKALLAS